MPPALGPARDDPRIVLALRFEPGRAWRYESDVRVSSVVMGRQSVTSDRSLLSIHELQPAAAGETVLRIDFDPRSSMIVDGQPIRGEHLGRSMTVRRDASGALSMDAPPDLPNWIRVFEAWRDLLASPPMYIQDSPAEFRIGDRWRVQRRLTVRGNPENLDYDVTATLARVHASPEGVIAVIDYTGTTVMGGIRNQIRGIAYWNVDHGQPSFDDQQCETSGEVIGQSIRSSSASKARMKHAPGDSGMTGPR